MAEIVSDNLTLSGIIRTLRKLGGVTFLEIQSGQDTISLLCRKDMLPEAQLSVINSMKPGDYCSFDAIFHNMEQIAKNLIVWHKRSSRKEMNNRTCELIRAYDFLLQTLRCYLHENNYIEVRPPSIHYGATKAASFCIDFFGEPARLSSSNSLFLNVYAMHLEKAFSLQRCFRAEKSKTSKHLAEFDMLEIATMGDNVLACISTLESLIRYVVAQFLSSKYHYLIAINESLGNSLFPIKLYSDVEQELELKGRGLGRHERNFAETPTFILYYPSKFSSWTAKPEDSRFTKSFNLLVPGIGEIAEGNEKRADLRMLREKIDKLKLQKQLGWYADWFAYPDCLLSGFGLGIERLAMWLFGLKNIREIQPFFRDTGFSEIGLGQ